MEQPVVERSHDSPGLMGKIPGFQLPSILSMFVHLLPYFIMVMLVYEDSLNFLDSCGHQLHPSPPSPFYFFIFPFPIFLSSSTWSFSLSRGHPSLSLAVFLLLFLRVREGEGERGRGWDGRKTRRAHDDDTNTLGPFRYGGIRASLDLNANPLPPLILSA